MVVGIRNKYIVLFDGECNFCNSSVNFIIRHDKKDQFRFATLQSERGKFLLKNLNITNTLDSIILIENESAYIRSTAVLRILNSLSGLYSLFYVFLLTPQFIRDYIYNIVAKSRKKWPGAPRSCIVPTEHIKEKFIA